MEEHPDTAVTHFSQPVDNKTAQVEPFQPKMLCPNCGKGRLDYNGLLELECPACGIRFGGGAGYT